MAGNPGALGVRKEMVVQVTLPYRGREGIRCTVTTETGTSQVALVIVSQKACEVSSGQTEAKGMSPL